jgi:hypothetical protein
MKDDLICQYHAKGDCKAPEVGLKGCIFYPFFQLYKNQHETNSEIWRNQFAEALDQLRKQTQIIFRTLEGNGGEGLKVKVTKLETKLTLYVVLGAAAAGFVTHVVLAVLPVLMKRLMGG